jgi:ATP-dependent DNA helicase RecG
LAYPRLHPTGTDPGQLAMELAEFRAEYPEESQFVEFKAGVSGEQIQNTAVAFSNADGGIIFIGVADDGQVSGRALDAGTIDDIHRAMQSARDVGRYSIGQLDVAGKPVCVVTIARREEGFAQTSGGVVKVRRGTRDDPLFGAELVRFANERTSSRYESSQLSIGTDAISPARRAEVARAMGWKRATAERLQNAGLVDDDRLTVAGALYLLDDPSRHLGKAYVEVQRFPTDQTIDYDRREELRGPLHDLLTNTVERVMDELGTELVVLGVRRYDLARLPEQVLREGVANALAHRSYETAGTAVRIELRPSSVIIRSPGGLPEPVTVENIRETNAARNLVVISLLRRFGLAEDAGRGVDVMQDTMAEEMLDPPRFSDLTHEVRVELPVRSAVAPLERAWIRELEQRGTLKAADRIALVHAARGEILTNSRVRRILSIDAAEARDALQRLRDEGLLEQRGERGGATYRLSGSLRPPAGLRLSDGELDEVVVQLAEEGPIANAQVRAATGLDRDEALKVLERLVREGTLQRTGQRRGTRYLPRRAGSGRSAKLSKRP